MTTTLVSIDAADDRRGAARRRDRLRRRALRRQARLGDARQGRARSSRARPTRSSTISTCGRSRATSARATPTGCWRRPRPCTERASTPWRRSRAAPAVTPQPHLASTRSPDSPTTTRSPPSPPFATGARAGRAQAAPLRAAQRAFAAADARRRGGAARLRSPTPPPRARFFVDDFRPWRVVADAADGGFLHRLLRARGRGSLTPTPRFRARRSSRGPPISSASRRAKARRASIRALAGAQRRDGRTPRPLSRPRGDRGERRRTRSLWLADAVEVFLRPGAGLGAACGSPTGAGRGSSMTAATASPIRRSAGC